MAQRIGPAAAMGSPLILEGRCPHIGGIENRRLRPGGTWLPPESTDGWPAEGFAPRAQGFAPRAQTVGQRGTPQRCTGLRPQDTDGWRARCAHGAEGYAPRGQEARQQATSRRHTKGYAPRAAPPGIFREGICGKKKRSTGYDLGKKACCDCKNTKRQ